MLIVRSSAFPTIRTEHRDAAPVDGGQSARLVQVSGVRQDVRVGHAAAGLALPLVSLDGAYGLPAPVTQLVPARAGPRLHGAADIAPLDRAGRGVGRVQAARQLLAPARVRQLKVGRQSGRKVSAPLQATLMFGTNSLVARNWFRAENRENLPYRR